MERADEPNAEIALPGGPAHARLPVVVASAVPGTGATTRRWPPSTIELIRRSAAVSLPLTAATGALVVVSGLLPTAFSLATGALAGAVPEAVGRGWGSGQGRQVVTALAVATVVYLLVQVSGPVRTMVADILMRRLDESLSVGLMRATAGPRGIAHLEDSLVLDRVHQAQGAVTGATPGAALAYLAAKWSQRLYGLAGLVVVARFRWWLAALLAGGQVLSYAWRRRHWLDVTGVVFERTDDLRQADYLRRLATRPEAAKESRVFSHADWLVGRYRTSYLETMTEVWARRRVGGAIALAVSLLLLVLEGTTLVLVARAGADGTVSLAAAVVYAQAVLATAAVGRFDMDDLRLEDGLSSLRVLQALEEAVPEAVVRLDGHRPAAGLPQRAIRFEGVTFAYPGREARVFDGLDLDIEAGRSLAIVGVNGAGKTTLIKLLARLYDVDGGRITVDGTDLRDLDATQWQHRVAAIFQDFVRYPVSAYDNVAFGALDRRGDREAVEDAARRAGALDVVTSLPAGWDTVLNRQFRGGAELSGGEWQRIALARALFAVGGGAGVLVLDEPTASLDVRAEAALYDRFLDLTTGLTTIVVSHRFSTVRRAERIVVLEQGRVVEDGDHDALVARGGRYASMYALQARRFVSGDDSGAAGG